MQATQLRVAEIEAAAQSQSLYDTQAKLQRLVSDHSAASDELAVAHRESAKKTCVPAKKPYVLAKETYISAMKPCISAKKKIEPYISAQTPILTRRCVFVCVHACVRERARERERESARERESERARACVSFLCVLNTRYGALFMCTQRQNR